jgi:hypothetical protein
MRGINSSLLEYQTRKPFILNYHKSLCIEVLKIALTNFTSKQTKSYNKVKNSICIWMQLETSCNLGYSDKSVMHNWILSFTMGTAGGRENAKGSQIIDTHK